LLTVSMTRRSPHATRHVSSDRFTAAVDACAIAVVTAIVFWPVLSNAFVNWDDQDVLVGKAHLGTTGILRWAFTTTFIGHYQPLAWLVWSAVASLFGRPATAFHVLSVVGHALNAALLFLVALRLIRVAGESGSRDPLMVSGSNHERPRSSFEPLGRLRVVPSQVAGRQAQDERWWDAKNPGPHSRPKRGARHSRASGGGGRRARLPRFIHCVSNRSPGPARSRTCCRSQSSSSLCSRTSAHGPGWPLRSTRCRS
jgi:hypothetical protein